jgi:hypothetical protein
VRSQSPRPGGRVTMHDVIRGRGVKSHGPARSLPVGSEILSTRVKRSWPDGVEHASSGFLVCDDE